MQKTHLSTCVLEANFDRPLLRVDIDAGVDGIGESFEPAEEDQR